MKKLLMILGAVSVTASAGATVVACGASPDKEVTPKSTEMSTFLGGVARAAYLNNRKNYDMNYMLESNLLNDEKTKKFFDDSFGGALASDSIKTTGVSFATGKLPTDVDTIANIASIGEDLLSLDQAKDKKEQVIKLVTNATKMFGLDLSATFSPETKAKLQNIGQTVEVIGQALDMSNYIGKNYVNAINLSIVKFVNEFNKTAKFGKTDFTVANFDKALQSLTTTMNEMKKQGTPFSFDFIIKNNALLGRLIDVLKLTLLYVADFINNRNHDLAKDIDNQTILDFRSNSKITQQSQLDLKGLVSKISSLTSGSNSEKTGPVVIRNLIGLLFINNTKSYYDSISLNVPNDSLNNLIGNDFLGAGYKDGELGFSWLAASLINGMVDIKIPMIGLPLNIGNILAVLLGMVGSKTQIITPETFDTLIKGLLSFVGNLPIPNDILNNLKEFLTNPEPLSVLWKKNTLGPIFELLLKVKGDFSLNGILNSQLSDLFGTSSFLGLDFATSGPDKFDTIANIMKLLVDKAKDKDILLNPQTFSNVITAVGKIINQLADDKVQTVEQIVNGLDKTVLNNIFDIAGNAQGLKDLFTFFKTTTATQKEALTDGLKTEFAGLTYEETILSETQYKYQIEKAQITITIANEGGKNKITIIRVQ